MAAADGGWPREVDEVTWAARPARAAWQARLAWSTCGLVVAFVLMKIPFLVLLRGVVPVENPVADALGQALAVPFAAIGALIAARRPGNRIGWLLLVGALSISSAQLTWTYLVYADHRGGPMVGLAGWLGNWLAWPAVGVWLLLLLLFPDGHLVSRRWQPVAWAAVGWSAVTMLFTALYPDLIADPRLKNPVGLTGGAGELMRSVQDSVVLASIPIALLVLSAVSLLLRFGRSHGAERQQLKWLAYAVGLAAANIAIPLYLVADWLRAVTGVLGVLLIWAIPVAIGVAILRYRLYDIDRILNRTIVYGLLTALLGGVYAGTVLVFGQVFGGLGGEASSWAIAGATLAVAALFQPARRRVQEVVDRRFNRRRYNAVRTVAAFSARLRDEIDLDTLSAELLGVVDQTMEPTRVSLWLRPR